MLYKTLKVAAGRHSFDIGQELEFNDAEAAALLADGAIAPLTPVVVQAEAKAEPEPEATKEPEPEVNTETVASKPTKGKK